MERETIERTKDENGEMLNYDNSVPGNKVIITNKNRDIYPSSVFVKVRWYESNSEKVKRAKELSEKLWIPCIEIDKSLCRERLGLTPLTEKEERDLKVDKSL